MLRLTEDEAGLWERFQSDGAAEASLVPRAPELLPRWARARALGVAAVGQAHPLGVAGHELAVRRDAAIGAMKDGLAAIEALESEVVPRGLLTIVSDAAGVIVRARGGDAFPDEVRRTRLVEGARWDEGARGTNAIGTAIVEARPIAVIGRAHFESVNHGLFCYASPVLDAFGEVVAVVDVTGPLDREVPSLANAVRGAASAIEELLHTHAYSTTGAGSRGLLERMLDRSSCAGLLVEAPGRVRRMNDAALSELDLAGDTSVERLFGVGWNDLLRASAAGSAIFETRRRRFEVSFEPVIDTRGRTLALVCFLEREASRRLRRPPAPAVTPSSLPAPFASVIASDPHVMEAKRTAARLAATDVPVILIAETGAGKELFARAIHHTSPRASHPFVAVSCAAKAGVSIEAELFGHAADADAVTGASRGASDGKLAAAHRGTLFLDEITDLSPGAQAMLLRFLEEGSFRRVGESAARHADVRLVAGTRKDLPKLVEDGVFRSDLFYRIQGGCVLLPPVRQRIDRLELARALVAGVASAQGIARVPVLAPSAEAWILDHAWPGNVRELQSAITHAIAMSTGPKLEVADFPEPLVTQVPGTVPEIAPRQRALRSMAEAALDRARGNMSEAARALGVARSTLYRMLRAPSPRG